MNTILEKNKKMNRSNFLKSDLNKYLLDINQIAKYPRPLWFKGSRYR